MIEGPAIGYDAAGADSAKRGLQADEAVEDRWRPNGAAGVRSQREGAKAEGDGRCRTAARATGEAGLIVSVDRRAVDFVRPGARDLPATPQRFPAQRRNREIASVISTVVPA